MFKFFHASIFNTIVVLVVVFVIVACSSSKEEISLKQYSEYYPLQIGRSITYRLDSTNYPGNGQVAVVSSYRVRDLVEASINDNLNRPSFRIRRFIRNLTGDTSWRDYQTIMATPLDNGLEYVENNLRYIKLKTPVRENYTWKGNVYIDVNSSTTTYLSGWDYTYTLIESPLSLGNINFSNTITVNQKDDSTGNPNVLNNPSGKIYSVEKFAVGIGLVYKELLYWEYQPGPNPNPSQYGSRTGFGIKLTYLSSN